MKVELDLSDSIDTSDFAKKTDVDKLNIDKLNNVPSNINSLKSKLDKLDIGKLGATLVELSKLNNVVKNDVVKTKNIKKS